MIILVPRNKTEKTITNITSMYQIHQNLVGRWGRTLIENMRVRQSSLKKSGKEYRTIA